MEEPSPKDIGVGEQVGRWLDGMRGRPVEWRLASYDKVLRQIDERDRSLHLSQKGELAIREMAGDLKERVVAEGASKTALIDAFALVREAAARTLNMRHFDVQMVAGIALQGERFIEMQTGEGKTLVAVLPAYLAALEGRGVHVLTFNDYLAQRDARWMKPIYEYLGVSVGYLVGGMSKEERRRAYSQDVTYVTAREVGYDYLRQSLARDLSELVMRPLHRAIVDEADSILIDEARVPLVIAGEDEQLAGDNRSRFEQIAWGLKEGTHFRCDENDRNVYLTEQGTARVQELLGTSSLVSGSNTDNLVLINQALHARVLLKRDVDYIVRDGQVKIVDEFTGRVVHDRHWPDGLQRAVEAKERVALKDQGRVLNSISIQHLMGLYPHLSGMTGTILPSDEELFHFYGRGTVVIPPNKSCMRVDHADVLFTHSSAKWDGIVAEVIAVHDRGRPILIGTSSVEESETLAELLSNHGVSCNVLNAKNNEEEARIIADAGSPGAVTVSTNMAGRGTDIRLGGRDERHRAQVVEAGGLYVIGTNRFESRRVDDQLRGRAGRQGDPGESRFFVSLDDPLMVRFGVASLIPQKRRLNTRSEPVEDPVFHRKIATVQRIVEGQNFDIRKTLWNYTSLVEKQRRQLQARRTEILTEQTQSRLAVLCPEKYRRLSSLVGKEVLAQVERQIALYHLDRLWTDHLAHIADIREGIHLRRLGGQNPLNEFVKLALELYEQLEQQLDDCLASTFEAVAVTEDGIDLEKEGLKGPTSTWTYLVSDNPFEWLGSLTELANVGFGIATGLYFGLIFLGQALYRKIRRSSSR